MRRKANEGTTTRYIVVEEKAGGFLLNMYEIRPTKVKDGSAGYQYQAVSQEWFSKVEAAIDLAEIAFRAALNSGFQEVLANT
jgi:hypothetical protein